MPAMVARNDCQSNLMNFVFAPKRGRGHFTNMDIQNLLRILIKTRWTKLCVGGPWKVQFPLVALMNESEGSLTKSPDTRLDQKPLRFCSVLLLRLFFCRRCFPSPPIGAVTAWPCWWSWRWQRPAARGPTQRTGGRRSRPSCPASWPQNRRPWKRRKNNHENAHFLFS